MKIEKTVFIFCSLFLFSFGQIDSNFTNKRLIKTLKKTYAIEEVKLLEVMLETDPFDHGKLCQMQLENDQKVYLYLGRVKSCRAGGCSLANSGDEEFTSEYFDYCILLKENMSILKIVVFNYQATHGQEISGKSWLKQFSSYDGSKELIVNQDIDAISGATISVNALTEDVSKVMKLISTLEF